MDMVCRAVPVRGCEIPAFIFNSRHFFTRLRVYEDGLFDCWGLVDRTLFRRKVQQGWVRAGCDRGGTVSVHHLGAWEVGDAVWDRDADELHAYACALLEQLNPGKTNLLDYGGEDVRVVDGVRVAWPRQTSVRPVKPARFSPRTRDVLGTSVSALWREDDTTWLVSLRGFPDGTVQVGGLPDAVAVREEGLASLVGRGRLVDAVGVGSWLHIHDLGRFEVTDARFGVAAADVVAELRAALTELRGGRGPERACAEAYDRWLLAPGDEALEALRKAYLAVPSHLRVYVLGDMDRKDWPIRRALGLDD